MNGSDVIKMIGTFAPEGRSAVMLRHAARLVQAEFAAAEWVAAAINMFNRISILSEHRVRPRDSEGKLS